MKILATLIIVVLLAVSNLRRIKKHKNTKFYSLSHRHKKGLATNLYQFALGLLLELSGNSKGIDECLPNEWKTASVSSEGAMNDFTGPTTTSALNDIVKKVDSAVDIICLSKDILLGLVDHFTTTAKRRMRLFYQKTGRRLRKFNTRGWFGSAWNAIATVATKAAESVKNGVHAAAQSVANAATKVGKFAGKAVSVITDAVKSVISGILDKIVEHFAAIKDKLALFFKSSLMEQIQKFIDCYNKFKDAAANVKTILSSFISKIPVVIDFPKGFIKVVLTLICGWEVLKVGIQYLNNGLNEKDQAKKWNLYGKFTAKLITVISHTED